MFGAVILEKGTVYNPETNSFCRGTVAFEEGKMADADRVKGTPEVIDASGCIITTGLIDMHVHAAQSCSDNGTAPDPFCLPSGVTTAVDAGTTGFANFEAFYRNEIVHSFTDVRACLHLSPAGMTTWVTVEDGNPRLYRPEEMRKLFQKYPGVLVGVKTRASRNYLDSCSDKREALQEALSIAGQLKVPLVVHVNDPAIPMGELADMLRPGDVFCHMYQNMGETILDDRGEIRPQLIRAGKRGVLFDACNGRGNFSFKIALPGTEAGFWPGIISSDITIATRYRNPVCSLPHVMSKFCNMGMPLEQVFRSVTAAPAGFIKEPEKASLKVGTTADIAVFRLKHVPVTFRDMFGGAMEGDRMLIPQMTVREGEILYRQVDF